MQDCLCRRNIGSSVAAQRQNVSGVADNGHDTKTAEDEQPCHGYDTDSGKLLS